MSQSFRSEQAPTGKASSKHHHLWSFQTLPCLPPQSQLFTGTHVPPRAQQRKSGCLGLEVLWGRGRTLRKSHRYPEPGFAHFLHIETSTESKGHTVNKWDVWTSIGLFVLAAELLVKVDWIKYRALPSSVMIQFSTQTPKTSIFMLCRRLFTYFNNALQ